MKRLSKQSRIRQIAGKSTIIRWAFKKFDNATSSARALVDQRRLDGVKSKTTEKMLQRTSNLIQSVREPFRTPGNPLPQKRFTWSEIREERKKNGKKATK